MLVAASAVVDSALLRVASLEAVSSCPVCDPPVRLLDCDIDLVLGTARCGGGGIPAGTRPSPKTACAAAAAAAPGCGWALRGTPTPERTDVSASSPGPPAWPAALVAP